MTQSKPLSTESALPVPERDALLQSEKLTAHIKNLIHEQGGSIGFDQYMSTVLYEPGLGYYSAGSRKFGAEGDFVTAPEISPLFSQCLAFQCAQILDYLDSGSILELGAGTGVMARDLLLELEKLDLLPETYFILEVSADLKQRQQALLNESIPHLIERVTWLDSLPENAFNGVILANEILDALAVKRFKKIKGEFKELKVGLCDDDFIWFEDDADAELKKILTRLEAQISEPFPEDYISEINTNTQKWLSGLNSVLQRGVMLFIDYGYSVQEYYHPSRIDGSLLCHYRHRVHSDPFSYPGLQDITASVDFTSVAEAGDSLGLHVSGYTNQAYFLFGCGLEKLLSDIALLDVKSNIKITQQVKKLTLPEEMGERFKVIAMNKEFDTGLIGFSIMDQRVRL
ncbi:MAG: SAM-dependent methyltransferase [Proteobacteria bacterium]|nr:SAM-dependent methyltransferase [Pseudomonadota bacterium]NOG61052.1 SAM-dependent methyltransferase [Pseudomonadota bacterium]